MTCRHLARVEKPDRGVDKERTDGLRTCSSTVYPFNVSVRQRMAVSTQRQMPLTDRIMSSLESRMHRIGRGNNERRRDSTSGARSSEALFHYEKSGILRIPSPDSTPPRPARTPGFLFWGKRGGGVWFVTRHRQRRRQACLQADNIL